jgi:hypothetical protein
MPMSGMGAEARNQIAENGHAIVPSWLDAPAVCELSDFLDAGHAGVRNLRRPDGAGAGFRLLRGAWHFFNIRRRGELDSRLFHPLGEQQLGHKIAAVLNQRGDSDVPCTELTVCFT